MAQETSNNVHWAFYSFGLHPSHCLPLPLIVSLFCCHSVWLGGGVAILLSFCSCRKSPHEQLLVGVLRVLPWSCEWLLLSSWSHFIVINQNL
jgi:hypothetical protein